MSKPTAHDVRTFIVNHFAHELTAKGRDPKLLDDNFDFMNEGVVDSLGIVELISAVESEFGKPVDLSELDPEHMTVLGPLSKYISERLI
jgi:acyl carrier protein